MFDLSKGPCRSSSLTGHPNDQFTPVTPGLPERHRHRVFHATEALGAWSRWIPRTAIRCSIARRGSRRSVGEGSGGWGGGVSRDRRVCGSCRLDTGSVVGLWKAMFVQAHTSSQSSCKMFQVSSGLWKCLCLIMVCIPIRFQCQFLYCTHLHPSVYSKIKGPGTRVSFVCTNIVLMLVYV